MVTKKKKYERPAIEMVMVLSEGNMMAAYSVDPAGGGSAKRNGNIFGSDDESADENE